MFMSVIAGEVPGRVCCEVICSYSVVFSSVNHCTQCQSLCERSPDHASQRKCAYWRVLPAYCWLRPDRPG